MSRSHYETSEVIRKSRMINVRENKVTMWHQSNLELARCSCSNPSDAPHFWDRAHERGISPEEIKQLRYHGRLESIEIVYEEPYYGWHPKYRVAYTKGERKYVGVFAVRRYGLKGITCWVEG